MVTYFLAVLWLLVFAFSALPVYFCYNMDATCHTITVLTETPASINQLCIDARQYGTRTFLPRSICIVFYTEPLTGPEKEKIGHVKLSCPSVKFLVTVSSVDSITYSFIAFIQDTCIVYMYATVLLLTCSLLL